MSDQNDNLQPVASLTDERSDERSDEHADGGPVGGWTMSIDPDRVTRLLVAIVGVLIVLHALAMLIYRAIGIENLPGGGPIARLMNMDGETNVPTWFAVILLLTSAALAATIAQHAWRSPADGVASAHRWRWHWSVLAGLFLFMSLDEASLIHEELSRPLTDGFDLDPDRWVFWAWLAPYSLLGLAVLAFFFTFLRSVPRSTSGHLIVGGLVFVAGAAGMELVGREFFDPFDPARAIYLTMVGIEEVLEKLGVIIVIRGLLLHLRDHCGPVRLGWSRGLS